MVISDENKSSKYDHNHINKAKMTLDSVLGLKHTTNKVMVPWRLVACRDQVVGLEVRRTKVIFRSTLVPPPGTMLLPPLSPFPTTSRTRLPFSLLLPSTWIMCMSLKKKKISQLLSRRHSSNRKETVYQINVK